MAEAAVGNMRGLQASAINLQADDIIKPCLDHLLSPLQGELIYLFFGENPQAIV